MTQLKMISRRRINVGGITFRLLVALLYLFLLAPLLVVVVLSVSSNQYLSFPPQGFTWHWYEVLPSKTIFVTGLQTSLIVSAITTMNMLRDRSAGVHCDPTFFVPRQSSDRRILPVAAAGADNCSRARVGSRSRTSSA